MGGDENEQSFSLKFLVKSRCSYLSKKLGEIMKRVLTIISIVGTFTTGIFVSLPKPAYAYCVYNKTDFTIQGEDTRRIGGSIDKKWTNSIAKNERDCCPGDRSECHGATIRVEGGGASCEADVDARGWIVVHSTATPQGITLQCNVNEPV